MAQRDQTATNGALDPEELTEEKPASKGGKTFLVIALAIVLVSLSTGVVIAYMFYPQARAAAGAVGLSVVPDTTALEDAPVEYGEFLEFQGLIINPSDSDGRRYLMVNIGLEATDIAVLDEVGSKEVVIRDRILRLLGQRSVAELASVQLRDTLKEELLTAVNEVLREDGVSRLYFTQYVLQ
jgi:flagellar FliL protein